MEAFNSPRQYSWWYCHVYTSKNKKDDPFVFDATTLLFFLFFTASDSGADQLNYFWLSVWNTYVFQTSYFSQVALTYVTSRPERTGRPNQGGIEVVPL